ncbi:hypothetical protein P4193_33120 [Pseudomonas aeruginosa]|nr:hypothetical protein [Pseudomonas aeruginosa]
MELKQKVRAAQLSVLSKYGVLADFSALEETQLTVRLGARFQPELRKT